MGGRLPPVLKGNVMDVKLILLLGLVIIGAVVLGYLLYINGIMVLKTGFRTVMFIGSPYKAKFKRCTGAMSSIFKVKENRDYKFIFSSKIVEGTVNIDILDKRKSLILALNNDNNEGIINLNRNDRYYIVRRFNNATGEFELTHKAENLIQKELTF